MILFYLMVRIEIVAGIMTNAPTTPDFFELDKRTLKVAIDTFTCFHRNGNHDGILKCGLVYCCYKLSLILKEASFRKRADKPRPESQIVRKNKNKGQIYGIRTKSLLHRAWWET